MPGAYIPDRGHIVYIDFDPSSGREQQKRRPALVLSIKHFNKVTGFAMVAPITSTIRSNGFEVSYSGKDVRGNIMCQQIRSLDFKSRTAKLVERSGAETVDECLNIINAIFER